MPDVFLSRCAACEKEQPAWALKACPMCGRVVCVKCAVFEYGRTFCSSGCAAQFFYGDGDDSEGETSG